MNSWAGRKTKSRSDYGERQRDFERRTMGISTMVKDTTPCSGQKKGREGGGLDLLIGKNGWTV